MAEARVRGVFSAEDRTKPATDSVRANLKSLEKDFGKLSRSAQKVGKSLSLHLTAPIAGFAALSLKTAGDFESSMNRVEAKAKVAEVSIASLTEQAKELGRTTQFSARQAAEAQEILATAGFDTTAIYKSLPGVLNLAAAGTLGLAEAAGFTAATLKNFNLDSSRSADIADLLAKGSLLANQTVADLGEGLAKAGATANAFGVGINDTAAALSVLAEKSLAGSEGGIAFRNFLLELKSPTSDARKFLDALGLSITNADGSLVSIGEVLKTFNRAGISAANATDVFEKRVATTFIQLEAAQGSLETFNLELEQRTGVAAAIAAKNLEGLNGELTKLKSAFEGLQIAIADAGLLEFATSIVAGFGELIAKAATLNPELLKTGSIIAAIVAGIGPAIFVFGQLAASVGSLVGLPATFAAIGATVGGLAATVGAIATPILAVVGLVAAMAAGFAATEKSFRSFFATAARGALRDIGATVAPLFEGLVGLFRDGVIPILGSVAKTFGGTLVVALRLVAKTLRVTVGPVFEALGYFLGVVIPKVVGVFVKSFDAMSEFVASAFRTVVGWIGNLLSALAKVPGPLGTLAASSRDALAEMDFGFTKTQEVVETTGVAVETFASTVADATDGAADAAEAATDRIAASAAELLKLKAEFDAAAKSFGKDYREAGERDEQRRDRETKENRGARIPTDFDPVEQVDAIRAGVDLFSTSLAAAAPVIADLGNALTDSLVGAIDLFDQDSRTTWQRFEQAGKSVVNSIAQDIINLLARRALASLFSILPGVGPILGAIAGASGGTGGGVQYQNKIGSSSKTSGETTIYQSLLPGSTNDFLRASIAVQESDRRASRFLVGQGV